MTRTITFFVVTLVICTQYAVGKEIFTVDKIGRYLTKENPFMYSAVGQQYVDEARVKTSMGTFDTKLSSQYDNKEYC